MEQFDPHARQLQGVGVTCRVFNGTPEKSVITSNTMFAGTSRMGIGRRCLEFFLGDVGVGSAVR